MYPALHRILVVLYAALPAVAWLWALRQSSTRRHLEPLVSFLITCFSGIILGTAIVILFSVWFHGRVRVLDVIQTWYFLIALLLILRIFRWSARQATWRLLRVRRNDRGRPLRPAGLRASVAFLIQSVLAVSLGLPFIVGTLLVHRVKVHTTINPSTAANCDFEDVRFTATDGVKLAGWWIPMDPVTDLHHSDQRTVLLCFDAGDDLARQAGLLNVLVTQGYNVLAFDLRGHGNSDGQWTGFGDAERHDVLGAIRWLKQYHPAESEKIFGVAGGIGGAALIAAATDPGTDGQSLQALAVFDTYADLSPLSRSLIDDNVARPFRHWVFDTVIPVASAYSGTDLSHFSPAKLVADLWPRPILIIHGRSDAVVPFQQGQDLFDAATFPKQSLWLPGDHNSVYRSRRGVSAILQFFENARPVPAI
jgi:alpha-beta hydrolase superfamily lysophospholipase